MPFSADSPLNQHRLQLRRPCIRICGIAPQYDASDDVLRLSTRPFSRGRPWGYPGTRVGSTKGESK